MRKHQEQLTPQFKYQALKKEVVDALLENGFTYPLLISKKTYQYDITQKETGLMYDAIINYRKLILKFNKRASLDQENFVELRAGSESNPKFKDLLNNITYPFVDAILHSQGLGIPDPTQLAIIIEFHAALYEFKKQNPNYIKEKFKEKQQEKQLNSSSFFYYGVIPVTLAVAAYTLGM